MLIHNVLLITNMKLKIIVPLYFTIITIGQLHDFCQAYGLFAAQIASLNFVPSQGREQMKKMFNRDVA